MGLDLFFTLQSTQSSLFSPAPAANGKGPATTQGLNFIDLILTQLTQNSGETTKSEAGQENNRLLQSDNPALSKNPSLDVAKLLAANEGIEDQVTQDIKTFGIDAQTQISQTLALNQQALEGELKPIAAIESVIESLLLKTKGDQGHETAVNRLEQILAKLKSLEGQENPAFIATNLTPEQITQLQQQLSESGAGTENNNDDKIQQVFGGIFIGLISIIAPQAGSPVVVSATQKTSSGPQTAANTNVSPDKQSSPGLTSSSDLLARLNTLVTNGEAATTIGEALDSKLLHEDQKFKNLLQQALVNKSDVTGPTGASENSAPSSTNHNLSYLQGWPSTLTGSLLTPSNWSDPVLQELGVQAPGLSVNSPGNLINLITNAQSASQAHGTTQIIAAAIQKNAAGGENKNITLHLDPPELGRVKIRLEFGDNKTLKTTMLVEKPETFLMLQRDAHVLERSLQEIGLDSGSGMEFELAQHDGDFGQDGRHDDHNSDGNGDAQDVENETIETRMDWYVDPQTGMTRYDVLV